LFVGTFLCDRGLHTLKHQACLKLGVANRFQQVFGVKPIHAIAIQRNGSCRCRVGNDRAGGHFGNFGEAGSGEHIAKRIVATRIQNHKLERHFRIIHALQNLSDLNRVVDDFRLRRKLGVYRHHKIFIPVLNTMPCVIQHRRLGTFKNLGKFNRGTAHRDNIRVGFNDHLEAQIA